MWQSYLLEMRVNRISNATSVGYYSYLSLVIIEKLNLEDDKNKLNYKIDIEYICTLCLILIFTQYIFILIIAIRIEAKEKENVTSICVF